MVREFILRPYGKVTVVADICPEDEAANFYDYPYESRLFGSVLVNRWLHKGAGVNPRDINAKLVAFPTRRSEYLVTPLLHSEK